MKFVEPPSPLDVAPRCGRFVRYQGVAVFRGRPRRAVFSYSSTHFFML